MSTPPPGGPPPPPWGPYGGQTPPTPSGAYPNPGGYQQGPPPGGPPGGPGYGYTPPPQPPKRSRLLPILAVVAVMVVLVGVGLGVGLVVLGGDDGEPDADPTPTGTSSSAGPTESSSDPTPTEPTTSDTPTVPPGPRFEGTGYSYPELDGWNDVTRAVKKQNPALASIDVVVAWGKSIAAGRANMIVEATSSFGATGPGPLRQQWEDGIAAGTGADPQRVTAPEIAGEKALGLELRRTNEGGVDIVQTAYLTVHDDTAYSITYSRTDSDPESQDAFGEMLDGWAWTS